MSSIIGFLERMGRDSQLRHAGEAELAQALQDAGIEPMLSSTVVCGDLATLEATLHVDRTLCCLIYAPLDDDKEEKEEREDDGAGDEDESESDPQGEQEDVSRQ